MYLRDLTLTHFKNYTQEKLTLSPRLNGFVGKNGMGKTNILDAIYYLCMCRSHTHLPDSVIRQHGAEIFRLEGHFITETRDEHIVCKNQPRKKKIFERNKVAYTRLADHIGLLPVVMITPDDTALIREGSEYRRRFMNHSLGLQDNAYLKKLIRYNKILDQRNALLKNTPNIDRTLLEIYDQQMAPLAEYLYTARTAWIKAFEPIFQAYYCQIAGTDEPVACDYKTALDTQNILDLWTESREKDLRLQRTTQGPHKDDLQLTLFGHPAKRIASQGQLKSLVLALKLAQYERLRQTQTTRPLLLLDDIFDKLDQHRVQQLLALLLQRDFGQVCITDTDKVRVQALLGQFGVDYALFEVAEGKVLERMNSPEA